MDMNSVFTSPYLRACDLQGNTVTVKIKNVLMQEVGRDKDVKPVMYFEGKEKGVVINKTKSGVLETVFGSESDHWIGQSINLAPGTASFEGKSVPCINFSIAPMTQPPVAQPAPVAAPQPVVSAPAPVPQSFTAEEADNIVAQEVASSGSVGDPPF